MGNSTSCKVGAAVLIAFTASACDSQRVPQTTPTAIDPVLGRYALSVTAGSGCAAVSNIVSTRTYTASVESRGPGSYVVTLNDADFLADEQIGERAFRVFCSASYGLGCNQFTASREGDQLRFRLAPNAERFNDEFAGYGGMIVELIPPDKHQLGIQGTGLGRLDGTTINASIDGRVWYCPASFSNYSEECTACEQATNVAMTFIRR